MSTAVPKKASPRSTRKVVAAKKPKAGAFRLGYAAGKITVAPGVDLTKPTLPAGKYL